MFTEQDEYFMQQALLMAERAQAMDEVPVGAVMVKDGVIIARASNQPISLNDPTAHAEISAIRQAAQQLGNYRLVDTTLYVTLEPCAMCAGALVHARVKRLVYAATDPKTGACGSILNIAQHSELNHQIICESGLLAEQAGKLLKDFFQLKRK